MYGKRSGLSSKAWRKSMNPKSEAGKGVIEVDHVNKKTLIQRTYSWKKAKSSSVHIRAAEHGKKSYNILNVHIHYFSKIKSKKEVTTQ